MYGNLSVVDAQPQDPRLAEDPEKLAEFEARIDRALGFPTHDPHGDPIPDANLEWPKEAT